MSVARMLRFPNPVNEVAARLVAAGVVVMSLPVVLFGWTWLLIPLALGFVLRVAAGPRWSPLALVVTRLVVPRLRVRQKLVAGPPKRFAQAIGATLSIAACVATFVADAPMLGRMLAAMIAAAAFLESAFALCLGCAIFAGLMRIGVIPQSVCAECAEISERLAGFEARDVA
ncbi:MAG: DUF4395 domain-containing protein [Acidimicrobiia bacterium]